LTIYPRIGIYARAVYVLHAFQKKSATGKKTAKTDIELIRKRLKSAKQDYEGRDGKEN